MMHVACSLVAAGLLTFGAGSGPDTNATPALTDQQVIDSIDWAPVLGVRARWPIGVPLVIEGDCPGWVREVTITPRISNAHPLTMTSNFGGCGNDGMSLAEERTRYVGGALDADATEVVFDIRARLDMDGIAPERELVGVLIRPITMVASVSDAISPMATPEAEAFLRTNLEFHAPSPNQICAGLDWDSLSNPMLENTAMPIIVEVVDGEGVVRTRTWFDSYRRNILDRGCMACSITGAHQDPPTDAEIARWTVRVRGDIDAAVKDVRFEEYWAGEFSVPYLDAIGARPLD